MEIKDKQELYNKILKLAAKDYVLGETKIEREKALEELLDFMEYIFNTYKKEDPEQ